MRAARAKDEENADEDLPRRSTLEVDECTEFVCGSCSKGGACLVCKVTVMKPEVKTAEKPAAAISEPSQAKPTDVETDTPMDEAPKVQEESAPDELLFRCIKCKRLAHYAHLAEDDEDDRTVAEIASFFQRENEWQCGDCASFTYPVEKILAWRPYPTDAVDKYKNSHDPPNYKENLPREYLIKWERRSYRRVQWVPHMWLSSTAPFMLRHFLHNGSRVELLAEPVKEKTGGEQQDKPAETSDLPVFVSTEDSREASAGKDDDDSTQPLPLVDAEDRIPPQWKTIERVLDIMIWSPSKDKQSTKSKKKKRNVVSDEESDDQLSSGAEDEFQRAFEKGDEPSATYTETIDEYESRTGQELRATDVKKVLWAFMKWDELTYDEGTYPLCDALLPYLFTSGVFQPRGIPLRRKGHQDMRLSRMHSSASCILGQ